MIQSCHRRVLYCTVNFFQNGHVHVTLQSYYIQHTFKQNTIAPVMFKNCLVIWYSLPFYLPCWGDLLEHTRSGTLMDNRNWLYQSMWIHVINVPKFDNSIRGQSKSLYSISHPAEMYSNNMFTRQNCLESRTVWIQATSTPIFTSEETKWIPIQALLLGILYFLCERSMLV